MCRPSDIAHPGSQARGQGGAGLCEKAEGPHHQLMKSAMPRHGGTYRVLRLRTRRTDQALTAPTTARAFLVAESDRHVIIIIIMICFFFFSLNANTQKKKNTPCDRYEGRVEKKKKKTLRTIYEFTSHSFGSLKI